jgi:nucleoside-diphosphate kinase
VLNLTKFIEFNNKKVIFMIERTFIALKPDTVQRGLIGEIISRFEKTGLKVVGMKMVWVTKELSKKHYKAHVEKPFYPGLEAMITEGPVIAMVLEGVHSIELVRKLVGSTEPKSAAPGTIRGDYSHISYSQADSKGIAMKNIVHASGNNEEAEYEINLWFSAEELHTYETVNEKHVF